ncbi:MAG: hypothetical protein IT514_03735 [Burkholderiales bacterium]|nr:hypothetical protein [Burkholderiales bacterium]
MWELLHAQGRLPQAARLYRAALGRRLAAWTPPVSAPRRRLEGTLLCAVDCDHPALAVHALRRSLALCEFDGAKLLTDAPLQLPDIEVVRIAPLGDAAAYSRFMMKGLLSHVGAERVLVVQWDGFVADAARWEESFTLFDYVGARWPREVAADHPGCEVGNGGFSLRSRALLEALQDPAVAADHPEDAAICRGARAWLEARHGIAFAPGEVADRFSYEHCAVGGPSFGFHGLINLGRHLPWPEFASFECLGEWLLEG